MRNLTLRQAAAIGFTAAFLLLVIFIITSLDHPAASAQSVSGPIRAEVQGPDATAEDQPTDQIIVKFSGESLSQANQADELQRLSRMAGIELEMARPMSGDAYVLSLPQALPSSEVEAISARLAANPAVVYAEPDRIKQVVGTLRAPQAAAREPNDTYYNEQWHYRYAAGSEEGINLPPAWAQTTGSPDVFVGVIDNGILPHEDLAGRTTAGYDFVRDPAVANDGNGRDPDPSDPGDWVPPSYCSEGSPAEDSSWHGTHVAGTIGAATDNGKGVAGVNWRAGIVPVRALGRCGGYTSDIIDGMLWAAGFDVPGVPLNRNPARVLNLSIGGRGACLDSEQQAIDRIVQAGTVIVVAAGNSNEDAGGFSPANCKRVITVAATNRAGDKAFYSNFGGAVSISAPGGDFGNGVLSVSNDGTTAPGQDNYAFYAGTSMAVPHVAGVASLLIGQNPGYSPEQVLNRLQTTARQFPAGSSCNTSRCGAGIVDAGAALKGVDVATPTPAPPPTNTPRPLPPAPVLDDIVNSDSDGNFVVNWSAVAEATSYQVNQKRNDQSWKLVYEGGKTSLKRIDLPDGEYCYRIRSVNAKGSSVWSEVKCTIAGSKPEPPATATPRPPWKPTDFIFIPRI